VVGANVDPTRSLVISQVVLSFGIPFALVALLVLCCNCSVMGVLVNGRLTTAIATGTVALIIAQNVLVLYQAFFS
jgi:manganese transport protein